MKKKDEAIDIEFTEQIVAPVNYANTFDLRWTDLQGEEEHIPKTCLIENLQKQVD